MSKDNVEYIIVGDTKDYKECLVYCCGISLDNAEKTLNRILTNPNNNDKRLMTKYDNFKIKTVPKKDCWWNDKFLVN